MILLQGLVNYSYLSDGTKLSALDGSGEGLVYRGPFVYRKRSGGNAGSSLTLESAAFGGGLMTPSGAMFYVTDYLGSVRAVVDGKTGDLYKASDYSAFGDESVVMVRPQGNTPPHPLATAVLPAGLTLRDGYTGKEAQNKDFGTSYIDFGARQYSPALRRWMTPDPLSEKYYGVSPYAFCNNNPVNLVDPDGRFFGDPVRNPNIRRNRASNLYGKEIRYSNGGYRNHQGFDYYAPEGTEVLSVQDGIVVSIVEGHKDYGNSVTIEHLDSQNNKIYSFYAHLSEIIVEIDDVVSEGQVIAKSGVTGNASNLIGLDQHLHFELRSQPGNTKGLAGKIDPNGIVDTKFISQDPNAKPQTNIGIIKIYPDETKEYKNIID